MAVAASWVAEVASSCSRLGLLRWATLAMGALKAIRLGSPEAKSAWERTSRLADASRQHIHQLVPSCMGMSFEEVEHT